ncbi:MAG TPA: ribosome biogenesis GTPase YlqF [Syntrophomonadaceae bacterium]|nr:ribosome biogenesis GTPase YlqF [Syntrophomonadaceae bacterium]
MAINWYPGHMVKAKREIRENMKLVDIVVILVDARAPFSCRNKELEEIVGHKPIVFILNKNDLAIAEQVRGYKEALEQEGFAVASIDSISGKGSKEVVNILRETYQPIADKMLEKGRRVRPARIMVVGVPNVGKSTFLNTMVGKKMVKTGPKPGVTRGKQWIRKKDIEFMDTPGLMWPKIENEEQGLKLALLDIVGENSYQEYQVALYLIKVLRLKAPEILREKFKLDSIDGEDSQLLEGISRSRGHLVKGGGLDLEKTAHVLLQEFRRGSLVRLCLD